MIQPMSHVSEGLGKIVTATREATGLVGLGAIVMQGEHVIGLAVSGERKKGSGALITTDDRWHIGSITKSFTATMLARLIESGDLHWDTTIGQVFTDDQSIHPAWQDVTIEHLLTHASGAAPNFSLRIAFKKPEAGASRIAARAAAVKNVLAKPPKSTPGSTFVYSNLGYTIAGVIAEQMTGKPWEDLVAQEILAPLGLASAGFGTPQDAEDKISQPWGHHNRLFGFTVASKGDNTPIIGPAGTLHCSLRDLASYGYEHLQGLQGRSKLLSANTFTRLHQPHLNHYALGWIVGIHDDLGVGQAHWHNGSNTMWYALLAIVPETNTVIAITANDGNIQAAEKAAWEIITDVITSLAGADTKPVPVGV